MGDASMSVEQGTVAEQQPVTENIFDIKVKRLFSGSVEGNKWNNRPPATPSELEAVDKFLSAEGRFTDNWWEGLYTWLDQRNFHGEKYSIAQITLESLNTLPSDTKLPSILKYWISNICGWQDKEPERKQIVDALRNPSIPLSLRTQLGKHLAKSMITPYSIDPIMQAYGILGEDIGGEVREQILPLFVAGLAYDQYELYKEDLIKLFAKTPSVNSEKPAEKRSFLSRISSRFKSKTHEESHLPNAELLSWETTAERRMEILRDFVLVLFPPIPKDQDPNRGKWERLRSFTGVFPNPCKAVGSDMFTLPIETLEKYLAELRQLKELTEFTNLSDNFFTIEGIVAPYVALGRSFSDWDDKKQNPLTRILRHLNELDKSGSLDDRIADEVLLGIGRNTDLFSNDQVKTVARRNLKILTTYQLPQKSGSINIGHLLTIPEEKVFKDVLDTAISMVLENKQDKNVIFQAIHYLTTEEAVSRLQNISLRQGDAAIFLDTYKALPALDGLHREFCMQFNGRETVKFFKDMSTSYSSFPDQLVSVAQLVGISHISKEMALAFPEHAPALMQDKMKETRTFILRHVHTILKDTSDLKFLNRIVGEFGQKADFFIRGYQECLEASVITTVEKELVLEFARQFRVVAPTTLAGYKEAKQGGFEKVYIAQLKALAERMTGSGAITDDEKKKPYYKDLLRHVYPNNAGQWSSFENNDSCSDRTLDLTEFKMKPRYEIDLLSNSEIRIKAGETLNRSVQDEVQQPILEVAGKMNVLGNDKEKIMSSLQIDIDKALEEIAQKGDLQGIDLKELTSIEEKMFLVLTDSIYGTRSIDSKRVKDLVITYEFAAFEDISDYIAGTRDRVGRASNQDYALLCEVGAFYSDRIKEINRRLVTAAYNNPQITALMPKYFTQLSQDSTTIQRQDRINKLQIDKLGVAESFVEQLTRVLEKRKGRKYPPSEVAEIIRRYESSTGGLQEKASISKNPQTRAFYGQLRSQREKTFEALQVIADEKVDPKTVHLGEINLQQALETETGIKEGKYNGEQFASYTVQRFIDLFDNERTKIEAELAKFESMSGTQREILHGYITKSKESANARMVGGVCVAGDNPSKNKDKNMWDMPNYFQLVFQEPDTLQCQGLVLLHHFTQDGKRILTASINPSSTYLYSVDEAALFNGIMGTLGQFAQDNNFDMITVSQNKTIRTNRTAGQFEKSMDTRIASVGKKFRFNSPQTFSYNPNYQLQEMDVVWEKS